MIIDYCCINHCQALKKAEAAVATKEKIAEQWSQKYKEAQQEIQSLKTEARKYFFCFFKFTS